VGVPTNSDRLGLMQISEAERVYRLLKEEITNGNRPPGSQLSQESIAAYTNASRTPAREAVLRLASDGLVRLTPGHGATVSEISMRDFLEVNYLRWILEGHAAQLAAERIPLAIVEEFEHELAAIEASEDVAPRVIAELDQRIHRSIAAHCGNSRLCQLIEQFNDVNAIARNRDIARRSISMVGSLEEIVTALRNRDGAQARSLMQGHIQEFSVALQSIMEWPAGADQGNGSQVGPPS
jgi:DNA-binding GntR family transcriptional regulator